MTTPFLILILLIVGTALIIWWGYKSEKRIAKKRWRDAKLDPETRKLLKEAGYPV